MLNVTLNIETVGISIVCLELSTGNRLPHIEMSVGELGQLTRLDLMILRQLPTYNLQVCQHGHRRSMVATCICQYAERDADWIKE